MKKFFIMLEDLWVAVAFAESGEYEILREEMHQPQYREGVRARA